MNKKQKQAKIVTIVIAVVSFSAFFIPAILNYFVVWDIDSQSTETKASTCIASDPNDRSAWFEFTRGTREWSFQFADGTKLQSYYGALHDQEALLRDAMQLCGEIAKANGLDGRYLLFHKVREKEWHPGHTIPVVHVKLTYTAEIPKDPNEIDKLPYIQIFSDGPKDITFQLRPLEKPLCEEALDEIGYYPVYEIGLIFTSQRSIPKSLVYLGSYPTLSMPKGEVVYTNTANVPVVFPKEFEEKIIDYYLGHNLRQYAIYQRKE